jgi:hypothetical protein
MAKRYNFSYDGKPYGYVVFENGELIDMQFYDPQLHLDMSQWIEGKKFTSIRDLVGRGASMWNIEEVNV